MHIKKSKGSSMISVVDSNIKHESHHHHSHMGRGMLHNGMSLFQDLKLKRRKVDSRCSSDGESFGTSDSAPSLSPDAHGAQSEGSPKEKERCVSPEEPESFLFLLHNRNNALGGGVSIKNEPMREKESENQSKGSFCDEPIGRGEMSSFVKSESEGSSGLGLSPASISSEGKDYGGFEAIVPSGHLHARLTAPPKQQTQQVNHNNNSPMMPELRTLNVVTSTSLSFHQSSSYRINGVRPELISGGAVTSPPPPPPHSSPPHQISTNGNARKSPSRSPNSSPSSNSSSLPPPSRTPTVIMGEAGGVRTMLWSSANGETYSSGSSPRAGLYSPGTNPGPGGNNFCPAGQGPNTCPRGHGCGPNCGHGGNSAPRGGGRSMLSMEKLWANEALNLSRGGQSNGYGGGVKREINAPVVVQSEEDEYEQPMICMICEDRATGLHYGIITCEGCKGFFKRTVQNRRVYTCVADGTCEITKAHRNRCQYCRFKKCIEQGMVLQAVREDRMPGGRNSGAVYNLYKVPVKYRKHKKGNRANSNAPLPKSEKNNNNNANNNNNQNNGMNGHEGGTILKAALTSPSSELSHHLRQVQVGSGPPPSLIMSNFEQAANMISHLVQCDNFHDIAALQNWEELLEGSGDLSEKLCTMGDSIVYRLVQWTKRLPFYSEIPVEVHTRVLTHKWHELLVLTTTAWQAMHTPSPSTNLSPEQETLENIQILQRCLTAMMGRALTVEQLRQDVGQVVEQLTYLTRTFRRLGLRLEEFVSLKVIAMLQNTDTKSNEVIKERYIKCLKNFLEVTCPNHPNRIHDLLRTLPEVQAAAALLLESKMFYVPFLLNSALLQR